MSRENILATLTCGRAKMPIIEQAITDKKVSTKQCKIRNNITLTEQNMKLSVTTTKIPTKKSSHQGRSIKKIFLKFSQNSHGNTFARVSFLIKLQFSACNFIKRKTLTLVFQSEFCKLVNMWIFKNPFLQNSSGGCSFNDNNENCTEYFTNITKA